MASSDPIPAHDVVTAISMQGLPEAGPDQETASNLQTDTCPTRGYSLELTRRLCDVKILDEPKGEFLEYLLFPKDIAELQLILGGRFPPGTELVSATGRTIYVRISSGHHVRLNGGFWCPLKPVGTGLARRSHIIREPDGSNFAITHPEAVSTPVVANGIVVDSRKKYVPNGGFTLEQALHKFEETEEIQRDLGSAGLNVPYPLFIYSVGNVYGVAFLEECYDMTPVHRYDHGMQNHLELLRTSDPAKSLPWVWAMIQSDFENYAQILRWIHSPNGLDRYHRQYHLGNLGKTARRYLVADWDTSLHMPFDSEDNLLARAVDIQTLVYQGFIAAAMIALELKLSDSQYTRSTHDLQVVLTSVILERYEEPQGYRLPRSIAEELTANLTTRSLVDAIDHGFPSVREEIRNSCI